MNYNRLSSGLAKLSDANASVSIMRDELAVLGPQIDAKEKVSNIKIVCAND